MALFTASLNSGSNGNCYYIGNQHEAVLIDAGISCREVEKRMKRLGLNMRQVKAIFISHEHSDHIRGIETLSKKYQLPVYITTTTLSHAGLITEEQLINRFQAHESIKIGKLNITAFPKHHDAADPHSFIITHQDVTVGVFTDIGVSCEHVIKHFGKCHAAFLETNYDEGMLDKGRYPYYLKRRIRGGKGHLSNMQALEIFLKYKPPYMSHLFLSHLSKDNNCPQLACKLFERYADRTEVVVTSRYKETALYHINTESDKAVIVSKARQYALF